MLTEAKYFHFKGMEILNTSNPGQQLNYDLAQASILGGTKMERVVRIRVILKVEYKEQVIMHNLDLYIDIGMDRLIKRCAERFSLSNTYVGNSVEEYPTYPHQIAPHL